MIQNDITYISNIWNYCKIRLSYRYLITLFLSCLHGLCPSNVRHQTNRIFEVLTTWLKRFWSMFYQWICWNMNRKFDLLFFLQTKSLQNIYIVFITLCVKEQSFVQNCMFLLCWMHSLKCFQKSVSFWSFAFNVITNITVAKNPKQNPFTDAQERIKQRLKLGFPVDPLFYMLKYT